MEIERIVFTNKSASTKFLLQCLSEKLLLVDLGFDRETLIFQLWYIENRIRERDVPPQGELNKPPFSADMWREEVLGIGNPSFQLSSILAAQRLILGWL